MRRVKVNFRQDRGSWIARAATERDEKLLGWRNIPVLRKYDNGDFVWNSEAKCFVVHVDVDTTSDEKNPAWWMLPKNDEWRSLLERGAPVMLRDGTGADAGYGESSVGVKRGIFATDDVQISLVAFKLKLVARLAECE